MRTLYDSLDERADFSAILDSPNFLLPEINALWIAVLEHTIEAIDRLKTTSNIPDIDVEFLDELDGKASMLVAKAKSTYISLFWNDETGYLFNAVFIGGQIRDTMECETGIVALSTLGTSRFSEQQLSSSLRCVKEKLLVWRRLVELDNEPLMFGEEQLPFGVLVKDEPSDPYYCDVQYHGSVLWPRSTPYLIKLHALSGMPESSLIIEDILRNSLDHQMSEGVLFYSNELFSLPLGNNPVPRNKTFGNPVPVKNPMQFSSQWCDPFLHRRLEQRKVCADSIHDILMTALKGSQQNRLHDTSKIGSGGEVRPAPFPTREDEARGRIEQHARQLAIHGVGKELPLVFISYSHRDETYKNELVLHLEGLSQCKLIELFHDRDIRGGQNWRRDVLTSIQRSHIAVLLVSPHFFQSVEIMQGELPKILQLKRDDCRYTIFPIIARKCAWKVILDKVLDDENNVRPTDGTPLWDFDSNGIEEQLVAITNEIATIARTLKNK